MTYLPPFVKGGRKVRKFPADHPASQPVPPKSEEKEEPKVEDPKVKDPEPKAEEPEEPKLSEKPDLIAEGGDPEMEVEPPTAKKKAKKKRSKKKKSADDDK